MLMISANKSIYSSTLERFFHLIYNSTINIFLLRYQFIFSEYKRSAAYKHSKNSIFIPQLLQMRIT